MNNNSIKIAHIYITGKVQGVSYRFWFQNEGEKDWIQDKDTKVTRLIEIIRMKNKQIKKHKREKMELHRMIDNQRAHIEFMNGSFGMVNEVVNNSATAVFHPEINMQKKPALTLEEWIARRFDK